MDIGHDVPEGRYLLAVPFTGFYQSDHDQILDDAVDQMLQDDDGEVDPEAADQFYGAYGTSAKLLFNYSKLYLEALVGHIEDETEVELDLAIHALDSPRWYNYSTDRLFATTDARTLCLLAFQVKPETLRKQVEEDCTSYSGFVSFYSNDLDDWPANPMDWDHNQLGILFKAWLKDRVDIPQAYELLEDARCNGVIDSLVLEEMPEPCHAILNRVQEQRQEN